MKTLSKSLNVLVLVIHVCAFLGAASVVQAQPCTPTCTTWKYWTGLGGGYYFDDSGAAPLPPAWRAQADWSADQWNAMHNHYGRTDLVKYPSNEGMRIIVEEPSNPDWVAEYSYGDNTLRINPRDLFAYYTTTAFLRKVLLHEFGHAAGFDDVVAGYCESAMNRTNPSGYHSYQDWCAFNSAYDPVCEAGGGEDYDNHCTPIIMTFDSAFPPLSSPSVLFDLSGTGVLSTCSWTKRRIDAFLILDRNGDGIVNDGSELFGSATPLSVGTSGPKAWSGFNALAVFDDPANGGNGDLFISNRDAVYPRLRLWFDTDSDGLSRTHELVSLDAAGVASIPLTAPAINREDHYGNVYWFGVPFSYVRGGVVRSGNAIDVLLVVRPKEQQQ